MTRYGALGRLPLRVDGYSLAPLRLEVAGDFTRVTTVVELRGGGEIGHGEDLVYEEPDQERFLHDGARLPLSGSFTFDEFSERLGGLPLFSAPPIDPTSDSYRRWAFESAALDLALRQAGRSLGAALDLEPRPLRFVVSMGLGDPPSLSRLEALLLRCPGLRYKLDARPSWDQGLIQALAGRGVVACVDLKGHYEDPAIRQPADARLYRAVLEGLPDAWIEDAALTPETEPLLLDHWARLSWDAPIRSLADLERLPRPPVAVNLKPSRFGTVRAFFDVYEACRARGITPYGGGDFELGPGLSLIHI